MVEADKLFCLLQRLFCRYTMFYFVIKFRCIYLESILGIFFIENCNGFDVVTISPPIKYESIRSCISVTFALSVFRYILGAQEIMVRKSETTVNGAIKLYKNIFMILFLCSVLCSGLFNDIYSRFLPAYRAMTLLYNFTFLISLMKFINI